MKGLNLEKVKDIFKKADIDGQVEGLKNLGMWVYNNITAQEAKSAERQEELKAMKESVLGLIKKD